MSCRWTDNVPKIPVRAVVVATFPMPAGLVFDWHTHTDHQLAQAASGLTVRTNAATWMLPPTRALWIPFVRRGVPAANRHDALDVFPRRWLIWAREWVGTG